MTQAGLHDANSDRNSGAALIRLTGLIGLLLILAPQATAQELSVETIYGSDDLDARSYAVEWMPDGRHFARLVPDEAGVPEVWRIAAVSGDSVKLISAAELIPLAGSGPVRIESVRFSASGDRVLLFTDAERVWRDRTRGSYFVFDVPTRRLIPVGNAPGDQMFAKFSPDADQVAFVRSGDLFVFDLAADVERRLTHDGSGTVVNGTTDWLYEEELGLRDAFRWSPDGHRIAYWRFDMRDVPIFELVDESSLYPKRVRIRYPKAGQPNSQVRLATVDVETAQSTWINLEVSSDGYLPWMEWAASSDEVMIQRLNRHQDRLDLLLADVHTGMTRLLFSEVSEAWLDVVMEVPWLAGGRQFLWCSDRDGFRHIYLYDRDGRLVRQVTRGNWDVTGLVGVDTVSSVLYFVAASESPMARSIQSADLDDPGQTRLLAGGRGMRSASFSPDYGLFIETSSTVSGPPRIALRDRDGSQIRVIEDNRGLRAQLDRLELREPEFMTIRAADGTSLNAVIMKPRDFDPLKEYPLLLYVYGGPGSQTVRDGWGGDRYLWHQLLVQNGVLVASVDNRGTGARGRDFKQQVYLRLGQLEAADQISAARQFGGLSFVDASRIGIWGWSYGGYMALLTTLLSDGEFAAAVAVAPVTDWKFYDTAYTERFMRTPEENADGYHLGAPLTYAERLDADLLIVHGTGDDNVHPQHTMEITRAFIEAGRPFEMQLYPGRRHSISGGSTRVHLFERITGFLLETLNAEPRPEAEPLRLGTGLFRD